MNSFNCWSCGACCRSVPDDVLEKVGLPKPPTQSGCGNLLPDNKCSIYETRPLICNVDGMFENHYKDLGITWEEYSRMSELMCKKLEKNIKEFDNKPKID